MINNIEKDIKKLEEKMNKELDFLITSINKAEQLTAIDIIAMKQPIIILFLSILSDYKRVLKENEELNYKLHSKKQALEIYNKYIPKSKIKDKIDKLQNDLKYIACGNNDCNKCFSEYRGSNFVYCYAYHQINVLNELLESEE